MPQIPQKNSNQWKVMKALVDAANDSFAKHAWFISVKDMTHDQFIKAISKLRERGWPIEDEGIEKQSAWDQHGYRLDRERWTVIKDKVNTSLRD